MSVEKKKPLFVAVDLFSGGGGLTLGLKEAGFLVCAAVEYDKHASATYAVNHPETILYSKDIRNVTGAELLSTSPTSRIDLIAACPPCQGFSTLTSKYKKNDPRNELIFEFARIIREVMPKTLMMENVPGLTRKGAHLFNPVISELESLGYKITYEILNVADYGIPQHRRRLVVLGSLSSKLAIPAPTHCENSDGMLPNWQTVREAISKIPEPMTLADTRAIGGPRKLGWNVVRNLGALNIARLKATRAGTSRAELPKSLRPACHQKDGGFSNVYGRMSWDKPSPTITGGCTTLSKGRFGHPSELRTISVREAAALQSFPENYVFETEFIDQACTIIGNALPPNFAKIMASVCATSLLEGKND